MKDTKQYCKDEDSWRLEIDILQNASQGIHEHLDLVILFSWCYLFLNSLSSFSCSCSHSCCVAWCPILVLSFLLLVYSIASPSPVLPCSDLPSVFLHSHISTFLTLISADLHCVGARQGKATCCLGVVCSGSESWCPYSIEIDLERVFYFILFYWIF